MGMQKFYAHPTDTFTWPNNAVGHRSGSTFDCLGPFAKVVNCPIEGTNLRRTCYAQDYADTFFSVPAQCKVKGLVVSGYFKIEDNNCVFVPYDKFLKHLNTAERDKP